MKPFAESNQKFNSSKSVTKQLKKLKNLKKQSRKCRISKHRLTLFDLEGIIRARETASVTKVRDEIAILRDLMSTLAGAGRAVVRKKTGES